MLCRRFLELAGYQVLEAANGQEALARVQDGAPDVITMDMMMPVMDGLECTRRLKADPASQDIPVIMLSANTEQEQIVAGLEVGAEEYITKPIRRGEFVLRVRSMARLYRGKLEILHSNEVRGEQTRALSLLLDLSQGLATAQSIDAILEKVVNTAAELTCSHRVSIMLPDPENQFLTIAKAIGVDESIIKSTRVPMGDATAGHVFRLGKPVVINTPAEARHRNANYKSDFFASVPLLSHALRSSEHVVGVLNITERENGRPFEPKDLEYIRLICNGAATAIDDALNRQARDEARDSIVVALATLAEYRDTDTGRHLDRVTKLALLLADELAATGPLRSEIDERFRSDLERAMPLHDVGKVAIPDHILLKPGKLTPEEMSQMRKHAEIGANAISSVISRTPGTTFLKMAEQIARSHHEWFDGSGYPDGLKGNDIPLAARLAAVVDVYDALTTKRVYKDRMPHEKAVAIIRDGSGTQFDPAVTEAFLNRQREFETLANEMQDLS